MTDQNPHNGKGPQAEADEQVTGAAAAAGEGTTPAPGGAAPGAADPATAPEGDVADEAAAGPEDELARAQAQAGDLQDQLARRNADLYNLQEEYNRYVRRAKAEAGDHRQAGVQSVAEALLGVLDDLDLARKHGDLEGPTLAIADKLENVLSGQFAIQRFGEAGEEFNPVVHEALTSMAGDVQVPTVAQVIQPGYRIGERVLRAARVAVQSPE